MNVFKREIRAHLKATTIWSIALFILLEMSMAKFDAIAKGGKAIAGVLSSFPHGIQVMFGMDGLNITSVAGYYGITFLYVVIAVALHAATLGVELIQKEESTKTSEFLYPKPISRGTVLFYKLVAGVVIMVVINLVVWLASYVSVQQFASISGFSHNLMVMMGALAVIQFAYFALGFLLGAVSRSAGRVASLIVVASYFIFVLAGFTSSTWLLDITPISYFNARDLLNGVASGTYAIICISLGLVFIFVADIVYRRRDLHG